MRLTTEFLLSLNEERKKIPLMKKYYEAYDERYKVAHSKGVSWSSDKSSPIVLDTMKKYKIHPLNSILEIGCGEGRDSKELLERGYHLFATDISKEAIQYCKNLFPLYKGKTSREI